MATVAGEGGARVRPLTPDGYERFLSLGAVLLLLAMLAAVARGHAEWGRVPALVWAHLATVGAAVALTPMMLLGRRGDRRHRWLGRLWVAAMLATAALTFGIRGSRPGHYSLIHLLSLGTLLMAPAIWWTARTHRVAQHRRAVRGMVTGALLVAGFFTFPFERLLGRWLLG